MDIGDLSGLEQGALRAAIRYWGEHWDWECPTLFGLAQKDMTDLAEDWPSSVTRRPADAALAIVGAIRELLYGASALRPGEIKAIVGIDSNELGALLDRLRPRIDEALAP